MKIGKFKVSKRAVSPVIATLLMIAIAVAASIIVYVWSIGLLGGLMGGGGSQVKEQIIMEAYNWPSATGSFTVTLRNVGSSAVTLGNLYVGGVLASGTGVTSGASIAVGATLAGTITAAGTLADGVAYIFKVTTQTGAVFSFSVIRGTSG